MLHIKPKSELSNCLPFCATKFVEMQDICFNYQVGELTPNERVSQTQTSRNFFVTS